MRPGLNPLDRPRRTSPAARQQTPAGAEAAAQTLPVSKSAPPSAGTVSNQLASSLLLVSLLIAAAASRAGPGGCRDWATHLNIMRPGTDRLRWGVITRFWVAEGSRPPGWTPRNDQGKVLARRRLARPQSHAGTQLIHRSRCLVPDAPDTRLVPSWGARPPISSRRISAVDRGQHRDRDDQRLGNACRVRAFLSPPCTAASIIALPPRRIGY